MSHRRNVKKVPYPPINKLCTDLLEQVGSYLTIYERCQCCRVSRFFRKSLNAGTQRLVTSWLKSPLVDDRLLIAHFNTEKLRAAFRVDPTLPNPGELGPPTTPERIIGALQSLRPQSLRPLTPGNQTPGNQTPYMTVVESEPYYPGLPTTYASTKFVNELAPGFFSISFPLKDPRLPQCSLLDYVKEMGSQTFNENAVRPLKPRPSDMVTIGGIIREATEGGRPTADPQAPVSLPHWLFEAPQNLPVALWKYQPAGEYSHIYMLVCEINQSGFYPRAIVRTVVGCHQWRFVSPLVEGFDVSSCVTCDLTTTCRKVFAEYCGREALLTLGDSYSPLYRYVEPTEMTTYTIYLPSRQLVVRDAEPAQAATVKSLELATRAEFSNLFHPAYPWVVRKMEGRPTQSSPLRCVTMDTDRLRAALSAIPENASDDGGSDDGGSDDDW